MSEERYVPAAGFTLNFTSFSAPGRPLGKRGRTRKLCLPVPTVYFRGDLQALNLALSIRHW